HCLRPDDHNATPPNPRPARRGPTKEHPAPAGPNTYPRPEPFFVLATQNPIEQEGTYPLPEAQLDRFMFMVKVGYPRREEEIEIMRRTTSTTNVTIGHVLDGDQILRLQEVVRQVVVAHHVFEY